MADLIGSINWGNYRNIIRDAHDTFNQDTLIWRRFRWFMNYHGEDDTQGTFELIPLRGLLKYNDFKVWPLNTPTTSGELDRQTTVAIFNLDYLEENNWLNTERQFIFNNARDRIIHRGIIYKSTGDTLLSQAFDIPLLVHLVLTREETDTGTSQI